MTKEQVRQMYDMVAEFNTTAGTVASEEAMWVQHRLIAEEYGELIDGILRNDRAEILDACCDLLYVCYGELWLQVQDNTYRTREADVLGRIYRAYPLYSTLRRSALLCEIGNGYYASLLQNLETILQNHGFDDALFPCFCAIHANNMTKFANGVIKDVRGKIMKPAGYVPFDCAKWIAEWEARR